jgi:hypothetical protein
MRNGYMLKKMSLSPCACGLEAYLSGTRYMYDVQQPAMIPTHSQSSSNPSSTTTHIHILQHRRRGDDDECAMKATA